MPPEPPGLPIRRRTTGWGPPIPSGRSGASRPHRRSRTGPRGAGGGTPPGRPDLSRERGGGRRGRRPDRRRGRRPGEVPISPRRNVAFRYPPVAAFFRAFASLGAVMSTPRTGPGFPAFSAARKPSVPAPRSGPRGVGAVGGREWPSVSRRRGRESPLPGGRREARPWEPTVRIRSHPRRRTPRNLPSHRRRPRGRRRGGRSRR